MYAETNGMALDRVTHFYRRECKEWDNYNVHTEFNTVHAFLLSQYMLFVSVRVRMFDEKKFKK